MKPIDNQKDNLTIQAELTTDNADIALNGEIEAIQFNGKRAKKQVKRYLRKIKLLEAIHLDTAKKINAKRKAALEVFFSEDDKYIPDCQQTCDFHNMTCKLMQS